MAKKSIKVLKFGGTSMGSAESMKKVISIIRRPQRDARPVRGKIAQPSVSGSRTSNGARVAVAVVSAMSGVTDELIRIAQSAAAQSPYTALLKKMHERHINTTRKLVSRKNQKRALGHINTLFGHLGEVVTGVALVKELSPGTLDYVLSYGERLSAHILTEALNDRGARCEYLNARRVVKTDGNFGEAVVDFAATNRAIQRHFKTHPKLQIVTGFIGSTEDNKTTTLGRGGSGYSASIFGAALNAERIEIWTDVSGVYTADPRKVKNALPIASMTYHEAVEMAYFGAKVIHPPTMRPAEVKKIPIVIKNTFEPEAVGTTIGIATEMNGSLAKGISSAGDIAMLQVEGAGMLRMKGALGRLFGALAGTGVNVLLVTQASSQNSISFAVREKDVLRAQGAIDEEFASERAARLIDEVGVTRDLSIVAVVGEKMRHIPGVAGRIFSTLGKNGVNIVAIAQGSSELNVSVVVSKADESKALRAIHTAFFFPKTKPVNIFLMGTGLIGSTLLKQIAKQRKLLNHEHGFAIKVAGIANSRGMAFSDLGIDPVRWEVALKGKAGSNITKFIEIVKKSDLPSKVFVDCTASEEVARIYAELLAARISVVTPNKRANSGSYEYFQKLAELGKVPGVSFLYETNACAALPIISMIDDLVLSGDRIIKIEGILSGTLSYIFNQFAGTKNFSESVAEAKRLGYTEPDPRDDLNGMDVARKILILARKSGFPLELSDVKVESLLSPKARAARTVEKFFGMLKKEDTAFERKKHAAEKKGNRLRYVAMLEKGKASVGLRAFSQAHPFYELSGSDNIVLLTTERYSKTPLLIQGPGAGGDVTAAGVFADILRVARDAA